MKSKLSLAVFLPALFIAGPVFANEAHMKEEIMKCDKNKDGVISKTEFMESKEEKFREADSNGDGQLSSSEIDAMIKEKKAKKEKK